MMFRRKARAQSAPEGQLRSDGGDSRPASPQRAKSMLSKLGRSTSLPSSLHSYRMKGIMKFVTVDDSLHSKYGESSDSSTRGGEDRGRIQFKDLLIREYARTVGDNPSCSSGPPISIAWEYDPETKIIAVDRYEDMRPPRRSHFEMVLPRDVRQQMLRTEWNVSQAQIASAVRNNIRIKNQRRSTVNNLGKAEKMEEFFESAGSKLKQGIMLRKSTTKQARELDVMFQNANRAREQARIESMTAEMDDEDDMCAIPPKQPQRRPSFTIVAEEPSDDDAVGLDITEEERVVVVETKAALSPMPTISTEKNGATHESDENLENENPASDDSDECNVSL